MQSVATSALPSFARLSLDGGAIAITAAVALLTGVAFGLVPALAAGRANTQATLRDETRGTSESVQTRRARGVLVAGQIALCVSLLAGAGLLIRSLWAMATAPLGFSPDGALIVSGGLDGLKIWSAASGHVLASWEEDEHVVGRFSADGHGLLTGGGRAVQLWDVAPADGTAAEVAVRVRCLSPYRMVGERLVAAMREGQLCSGASQDAQEATQAEHAPAQVAP
jgi:hypothetical protein